MHTGLVGAWLDVGTATDGQRRHRALIAYLASNNLTSTAAALRAEIGLGEDVFDTAKAKKYEGLLEKKWTSVVRLQKKVGNLDIGPFSPSASALVRLSNHGAP